MWLIISKLDMALAIKFVLVAESVTRICVCMIVQPMKWSYFLHGWPRELSIKFAVWFSRIVLHSHQGLSYTTEISTHFSHHIQHETSEFDVFESNIPDYVEYNATDTGLMLSNVSHVGHSNTVSDAVAYAEQLTNICSLPAAVQQSTITILSILELTSSVIR